MPWNRPLPTLVAAILLFALGPVMALAPRGMPVWFLALAAVAGWELLRAGRPWPVFDRMATLSATALVLWVWIGSLWSPSPRALLTALEITYVMAGVYLIGGWFAGLADDARRRLQNAAAAGLALGFLAFGLEQWADHPLYRWWNDGWAIERLHLSNVPKRPAVLLGLSAWFLLLYARNRWPAGRLAGRLAGAAWLVPPLVAGYLLLGDSRSAFTGLAIGMAAWLVAAAGAGNPARRGLQGGVVAAFVLVLPAALFFARATADMPTDTPYRSALHRAEIWGHAATRALEAPVIGHGVDASRSLPVRDETSRFSPLERSLLPLHPHNAFLQIWLELGAVGAALAGALLWRLLDLTRRVTTGGAMPATLGYAASALAMAAAAYGLWQAWWMCGLAAGALLLVLAAPARSRQA